MPAAQPSKASVSNVISAIVAAGCLPGAVRVSADGSFTVEVASSSIIAPEGHGANRGDLDTVADAQQPPSWEDGK